MDLWFFIMELVMLLGSAFLLGALAQRLRQSPIVGYLLAGTIVGPLLFNAQAVNQTAELGVALLLFSIGLEFSFARLRQMGTIAFGGGSMQVAGTLLLVALALAAPRGLPEALTVGAVIALSSTAVVMRVLVDRAEIDSVRGRSCLGILLLQDIAIVPLVLMVGLFSPAAADTGLGLHLVKITAGVAGLFVGFYLLCFHIIPLLLSVKGVFASRELTVLMSIVVGLGAAWAAHTIGISPALGAFVAGMLLGESPYATQIRADIGALRTMMVTLFFASMGMLAKPLWFLSNAHWVLAAALLIFVLKTAIGFGVCRLFGLDRRHALATGISLGQVGEFSFVLAATARNGGVLDPYAFDLAVSVIIILMFAAPYMVSMAFPLADRLLLLFTKQPALAADQHPSAGGGPGGHGLIVGFGPAGQQVVSALMARNLQPVVIDINPQSRRMAKQMGVDLHLGDAGREEVLMHAGLSTACMAVVTLPDPTAAVRVVQLLRKERPQLVIAVRCRYNRHLKEFESAGADIIIDEETLVGQTLSQRIVEQLQAFSGAALACGLAGHDPQDAS
jgi:CPA2 family monovalent cation:H+ antiporter-2